MSPHPSPSDRPRKETRLGLSVSQLVASALAAASAAFGASYLGVAGTIARAAVASVIATIASAAYATSLKRTHEVVQSTVSQWTRTAATAPVPDPGAPRVETQPSAGPAWPRVAVAAAAVLVTTLGAVTGVEAVLGRPLAAVVAGSHATGTSLGAVGRSHASKGGGTHTADGGPSATTPASTPTAAPSTAPSLSPTNPSGIPTPSPSEPGATTTPSGTPTGTPTPAGPGAEPSASPSAGPLSGG